MKNLAQIFSTTSFAIVPCTTNCGWNDFGALLQNIFNFLITISIPLATLAIIYGAFLLLTSGGSSSRVEEGKKAILAALIGLAIVFGSWLIYKAIFNAITGQSMFSAVPVAMAVTDLQNTPAGAGGVGGLPIQPPPGIPTDVNQLINNITTWLLTIVAPIAALMILYGAFLILTAAGSSERYESGKKTILYAVIGLVIVIISKALVSIVTQVLTP